MSGYSGQHGPMAGTFTRAGSTPLSTGLEPPDGAVSWDFVRLHTWEGFRASLLRATADLTDPATYLNQNAAEISQRLKATADQTEAALAALAASFVTPLTRGPSPMALQNEVPKGPWHGKLKSSRRTLSSETLCEQASIDFKIAHDDLSGESWVPRAVPQMVETLHALALQFDVWSALSRGQSNVDENLFLHALDGVNWYGRTPEEAALTLLDAAARAGVNVRQ
jgi:hypothetical protein